MSLRWPSILGIACALVLLLPLAHAAPPLIAQTEVSYLLGFVGSSGCDFYRSGRRYDSTAAPGHLRYKYEWLVQHDQVKTTEDFIEKAATRSSLSGRPYKIRCNGGPVESTNQWLRVALARYRSPAAH